MVKHLLATCALVSFSAVVMAAKPPSGYVTICKLGQTCSVSQPTNVAFGANDKYVYKVLTGSFSCSVATFGSDPIPGKAVKECSISSGITRSSANASISSSDASSVMNATASLTATAANGQVKLNWSVNGSVTALEIYRDSDSNPSGRVRVALLPADTRDYTDTGLINGVTYWYWVKANSSGGSINSSAVKATPISDITSSSSAKR